MKKILLFIFVVNLLSCGSNDPKPDETPANAPKAISYSIVSTLPHDTSSFTEGLLFYKDKMYESTGEIHKSKLAEVDLKTGKIVRSVTLDTAYFGEGIVIINDTVYQWTYQNKVGLMYSLKDFKKIGNFKYESAEGWGMTTDGKNILASDGTSNLYFYEPGTFRLLKTQTITESGSPIAGINELEYIDGFIYANQWLQGYILKIDPNNGVVVGKINFSELENRVKSTYSFAKEFNGIAYNPTTRKIYVTGKNWPELYEVQFGQ
jgi:glutaminyl-peptide cyclotransferase